jgi:hypothetical protein
MNSNSMIDLCAVESVTELEEMLRENGIVTNLKDDVVVIRPAERRLKVLLRRIANIWVLNATIEGIFETAHSIIACEFICYGEIELKTEGGGCIWIRQ